MYPTSNPEQPDESGDRQRLDAARWLTHALGKHRGEYAGQGPDSLAHQIAELAMYERMGLAAEAGHDFAAEYEVAPFVVNKTILN